MSDSAKGKLEDRARFRILLTIASDDVNAFRKKSVTSRRRSKIQRDSVWRERLDTDLRSAQQYFLGAEGTNTPASRTESQLACGASACQSPDDFGAGVSARGPAHRNCRAGRRPRGAGTVRVRVAQDANGDSCAALDPTIVPA